MLHQGNSMIYPRGQSDVGENGIFLGSWDCG